MGVKVTDKLSSVPVLYVKKLAAALVLLSFLVISFNVLHTEASLDYQITYITFDSLIVYVAIRVIQWVVIKILTVYEGVDGDQN